MGQHEVHPLAVADGERADGLACPRRAAGPRCAARPSPARRWRRCRCRRAAWSPRAPRAVVEPQRQLHLHRHRPRRPSTMRTSAGSGAGHHEVDQRDLPVLGREQSPAPGVPSPVAAAGRPAPSVGRDQQAAVARACRAGRRSTRRCRNAASTASRSAVPADQCGRRGSRRSGRSPRSALRRLFGHVIVAWTPAAPTASFVQSRARRRRGTGTAAQ